MESLFDYYDGGVARPSMLTIYLGAMAVVTLILVMLVLFLWKNPKIAGFPWWAVTLQLGLNLMMLGWLVSLNVAKARATA